MSLTDTTDRDVERRLRDLADAAYAETADAPWLASTVLRRARLRRRRITILRSTLLSTALVGTAAAVTVGGGPYYEYRQPSAVMEPAVPPGSSVVVNRDLNPQRMDVVQLDLNADGATIDGLLRVVGTAGDVVACPATAARSCTVTINGAEVQDEYVAGLQTRPFPEVVVPEGTLFVLGDARAFAVDSRSLGPVDADDVNGVAVALINDEGEADPIAGAPRHTVPDDYKVDLEAPVPPASTEPG